MNLIFPVYGGKRREGVTVGGASFFMSSASFSIDAYLLVIVAIALQHRGPRNSTHKASSHITSWRNEEEPGLMYFWGADEPIWNLVTGWLARSDGNDESRR